MDKSDLKSNNHKNNHLSDDLVTNKKDTNSKTKKDEKTSIPRTSSPLEADSDSAPSSPILPSSTTTATKQQQPILRRKTRRTSRSMSRANKEYDEELKVFSVGLVPKKRRRRTSSSQEDLMDLSLCNSSSLSKIDDPNAHSQNVNNDNHDKNSSFALDPHHVQNTNSIISSSTSADNTGSTKLESLSKSSSKNGFEANTAFNTTFTNVICKTLPEDKDVDSGPATKLRRLNDQEKQEESENDEIMFQESAEGQNFNQMMMMTTPHAPMHPTQMATGTLNYSKLDQASFDKTSISEAMAIAADDSLSGSSIPETNGMAYRISYNRKDRSDSLDEQTLKESLERPDNSLGLSPLDAPAAYSGKNSPIGTKGAFEMDEAEQNHVEEDRDEHEEGEVSNTEDVDQSGNSSHAHGHDSLEEGELGGYVGTGYSKPDGDVKMDEQQSDREEKHPEKVENDQTSLEKEKLPDEKNKPLYSSFSSVNPTATREPTKGKSSIPSSSSHYKHTTSQSLHPKEYAKHHYSYPHSHHQKKKQQHLEKQIRPKNFVGCSKLEEYELQKKIGEGTFGEVSGAKQKKTGLIFALKKILMHNEKEGVPITAMREIKILKSLNHVNIIGLHEITFMRGDRANRERGTLFMVFPYMDHDLAGLLENPTVKLNEPQIKSYMQQLLEGTAYLHKSKILHRDMKASNILIDNAGNLKLADFGLARGYLPEKPDKDYTNCVVTRWYRPPELFLGATKYTAAIDMWGVGCVLGELYKRKPILPGSSDMHQLEIIFGLCGTPNETNWPDYRSLPSFQTCLSTFNKKYMKSLDERYKLFNPLAVDLMDKLLQLDPSRRWSAERALEHPYFWKRPYPAKPNTSDFKPFPTSHEYATRKERQEKMELMKHIEGGAAAHHRILKQPEPHCADQEIMEIGLQTLYGDDYRRDNNMNDNNSNNNINKGSGRRVGMSGAGNHSGNAFVLSGVNTQHHSGHGGGGW